jgi:hypothetical protein
MSRPTGLLGTCWCCGRPVRIGKGDLHVLPGRAVPCVVVHRGPCGAELETVIGAALRAWRPERFRQEEGHGS